MNSSLGLEHLAAISAQKLRSEDDGNYERRTRHLRHRRQKGKDFVLNDANDDLELDGEHTKTSGAEQAVAEKEDQHPRGLNATEQDEIDYAFLPSHGHATGPNDGMGKSTITSPRYNHASGPNGRISKKSGTHKRSLLASDRMLSSQKRIRHDSAEMLTPSVVPTPTTTNAPPPHTNGGPMPVSSGDTEAMLRRLEDTVMRVDQLNMSLTTTLNTVGALLPTPPAPNFATTLRDVTNEVARLQHVLQSFCGQINPGPFPFESIDPVLSLRQINSCLVPLTQHLSQHIAVDTFALQNRHVMEKMWDFCRMRTVEQAKNGLSLWKHKSLELKQVLQNAMDESTRDEQATKTNESTNATLASDDQQASSLVHDALKKALDFVSTIYLCDVVADDVSGDNDRHLTVQQSLEILHTQIYEQELQRMRQLQNQMAALLGLGLPMTIDATTTIPSQPINVHTNGLRRPRAKPRSTTRKNEEAPGYVVESPPFQHSPSEASLILGDRSMANQQQNDVPPQDQTTRRLSEQPTYSSPQHEVTEPFVVQEPHAHRSSGLHKTKRRRKNLTRDPELADGHHHVKTSKHEGHSRKQIKSHAKRMSKKTKHLPMVETSLQTTPAVPDASTSPKASVSTTMDQPPPSIAATHAIEVGVEPIKRIETMNIIHKKKSRSSHPDAPVSVVPKLRFKSKKTPTVVTTLEEQQETTSPAKASAEEQVHTQKEKPKQEDASDHSTEADGSTPNGYYGCCVCGHNTELDSLLLCDNDCGREFHSFCLSPPLENIPEGDWYCPVCLEQEHLDMTRDIYKCSAGGCDKITAAKYCVLHRCGATGCLNRMKAAGFCRRHDNMRSNPKKTRSKHSAESVSDELELVVDETTSPALDAADQPVSP